MRGVLQNADHHSHSSPRRRVASIVEIGTQTDALEHLGEFCWLLVWMRSKLLNNRVLQNNRPAEILILAVGLQKPSTRNKVPPTFRFKATKQPIATLFELCVDQPRPVGDLGFEFSKSACCAF